MSFTSAHDRHDCALQAFGKDRGYDFTPSIVEDQLANPILNAMSPATSIARMQGSRLLNLPAELRNKIYYAALIQEGPLQADTDPEYTESLVKLMRPLHVCRQIRSEAQDIFWSSNTFQAVVHAEYRYTTSWLKMIGPERANLITSLTLSLQSIGRSEFGYGFEGTTLHLPNLRREIWAILEYGLPACAIHVDEPSRLGLRPTSIEQAEAKKQELFRANLPQLVQEAQTQDVDSSTRGRGQSSEHFFFGYVIIAVIYDGKLQEAGRLRVD